MNKIGLFYGSETGNTETMAEEIQRQIGEDLVELKDVSDAEISELENFEKIIIGIPTWYEGELQSSWDLIFDELDGINFKGKTVAFFGCGDQTTYSENFLDAMGIVYEKLTGLGAKAIGKWPTDGYDFDASKAVIEDNYFCGVGFDFENQDTLNDERCETWCKQVKEEFDLAS